MQADPALPCAHRPKPCTEALQALELREGWGVVRGTGTDFWVFYILLRALGL